MPMKPLVITDIDKATLLDALDLKLASVRRVLNSTRANKPVFKQIFEDEYQSIDALRNRIRFEVIDVELVKDEIAKRR